MLVGNASQLKEIESVGSELLADNEAIRPAPLATAWACLLEHGLLSTLRRTWGSSP